MSGQRRTTGHGVMHAAAPRGLGLVTLRVIALVTPRRGITRREGAGAARRRLRGTAHLYHEITRAAETLRRASMGVRAGSGRPSAAAWRSYRPGGQRERPVLGRAQGPLQPSRPGGAGTRRVGGARRMRTWLPELGGRLSEARPGCAGPAADSRGDGRGRSCALLRGEQRGGHGAVAGDRSAATAAAPGTTAGAARVTAPGGTC
jgi:hypothetical protein